MRVRPPTFSVTAALAASFLSSLPVLGAPLADVCGNAGSDAASRLASEVSALPAGAVRPMTLAVDLTGISGGVAKARMTIPVTPGPISLLYPKWVQGAHGPGGPIADLTGLVVEADGKPIRWQRDPFEMWRFRMEVPPGVTSLTVSTDYRSEPPREGEARHSTKLAIVDWYPLFVYPEEPEGGVRQLDIPVEASVTLPPGWSLATALPVAREAGDTTSFAPVTLETLVDSPVLTGAHMKTWSLGKAGGVPHYLAAAGDRQGALAISPDRLQGMRRLVQEAHALFGAQHYESYRFLLTLSDDVPFMGLEHHQSSDNRLPLKAFTHRGVWLSNAYLMPHEYVHSWNGKHRRPDGLVTDGFQQPFDTRLLWVYEGLTEYLGWVLPTRSGMWTPEYFRDYVASEADHQRWRVGRSWRPLGDTATAAQTFDSARSDGLAWRRDTDYYTDGALLWLEADAKIRRASGGSRSLDDFVRAFHGGRSGPASVKAYTYQDVLEALDQISPAPWKHFFDEALDEPTHDVPTGGLEAAGWRLTYSNRPGRYQVDSEKADHYANLRASLGISVSLDPEIGRSEVVDVVPDSPADKAGIAPGTVLTEVNGRAFDLDRLRAAVAGSATRPVTLTGIYGSANVRKRIDYRGGARYPVLERIPGTEDLLTLITAPRR